MRFDPFYVRCYPKGGNVLKTIMLCREPKLFRAEGLHSIRLSLIHLPGRRYFHLPSEPHLPYLRACIIPHMREKIKAGL